MLFGLIYMVNVRLPPTVCTPHEPCRESIPAIRWITTGHAFGSTAQTWKFATFDPFEILIEGQFACQFGVIRFANWITPADSTFSRANFTHRIVNALGLAILGFNNGKVPFAEAILVSTSRLVLFPLLDCTNTEIGIW